jgi:hypothetical protein
VGDLMIYERTISVTEGQGQGCPVRSGTFFDTHTQRFTNLLDFTPYSCYVTFSSSIGSNSLSLLSFHIYQFTNKMNDESEDRKPTLVFNYAGFSMGEQNKVEDTTSSVKQRKLYNCVSPLSPSWWRISS